MIRDTITDITESGLGMPRVIMMGIKNKEFASRTFLNGVTEQRQMSMQSTKKLAITATVDMYRSDFGMHTIMYNRWMNPNTVLFLDMRYWELKNYRPYQKWRLGRSGDSVQYQVVTEYGLCCKHEKASGAIFDLNAGEKAA